MHVSDIVLFVALLIMALIAWPYALALDNCQIANPGAHCQLVAVVDSK